MSRRGSHGRAFLRRSCRTRIPIIRRRRSWQALIVASVVLFLGAVSVSPAIARTPSPQALYKALLASSIPKSQLPKGFRRAETWPADPDANDRRHHVVGVVEIDLIPDTRSIFYYVFPKRTDALGALNDTLAAVKGVRSRRPETSLPQPAVNLSGAQNGARFAEALFVRRNVLVGAVILSPRSASGGQADAHALAMLALRHLKAVEQRPTP